MTPYETIWIIGGGQFSRRAACLLSKNPGRTSITVVDRKPVYDFPEHVTTVQADGIEWLVNNLQRDAEVTRIIPAIPQHVAAYWLQQRLARQYLYFSFQAIPTSLFDLLPNPFKLRDGSVATSYATFMCPPNCSEPEDNCSATGLPREIPLYNFLNNITCTTYRKLVITSHQFAPGVGGYYPEELWLLLDHAHKMPLAPLIIATSCKCHGIISRLRPEPDVKRTNRPESATDESEPD